MDITLKIIVGLIAIPVTVISNGYVLSTGWEWFIVPLGAPHLGLWHALGVSALASYFLIGLRDFDVAQKPDKPGYFGLLFRGVVVPWFILGFLWIYKIIGGL